jgi:hypothetical protein
MTEYEPEPLDVVKLHPLDVEFGTVEPAVLARARWRGLGSSWASDTRCVRLGRHLA